jgi:UDP-galactopyranose mutase
MNFHLVGRFSEWEYYNMDMAILSAMKVSDQL